MLLFVLKKENLLTWDDLFKETLYNTRWETDNDTVYVIYIQIDLNYDIKQL